MPSGLRISRVPHNLVVAVLHEFETCAPRSAQGNVANRFEIGLSFLKLVEVEQSQIEFKERHPPQVARPLSAFPHTARLMLEAMSFLGFTQQYRSRNINVIVRRYVKGDQLSPHVDREDLFEEDVFFAVLHNSSDAQLTFYPQDKRSPPVQVGELPGSVGHIRGTARHEWRHGVPALQDGERISLTWRWMFPEVAATSSAGSFPEASRELPQSPPPSPPPPPPRPLPVKFGTSSEKKPVASRVLPSPRLLAPSPPPPPSFVRDSSAPPPPPPRPPFEKPQSAWIDLRAQLGLLCSRPIGIPELGIRMQCLFSSHPVWEVGSVLPDSVSPGEAAPPRELMPLPFPILKPLHPSEVDNFVSDLSCEQARERATLSWLWLSIYGLNAMHNVREQAPPWHLATKPQRACLQGLFEDCAEFCGDDVSLTPKCWYQELGKKATSYWGEQVYTAEPISLLRVDAALPKPGTAASVNILDVVNARMKQQLTDPEALLLPQKEWPAHPPKARTSMNDPAEWLPLAKKLLSGGLAKWIPETAVFSPGGETVVSGLFAVAKGELVPGTRSLRSGECAMLCR